MSLKRRLENQYHNFSSALHTVSLPDWVYKISTKIGLGVFLVVFGVLYLLQTSATAAGSYEIHNLEKQVDVMSADIQKVEIAIAEESAMPNLEKRLTALNLVTAKDVVIVAPAAGTMALR